MTKRKRASLVALAVMCVAVLGLAAAVYAKYISSVTKTGTATVAKWAFTTDNTSGTITCNLDETYDPDTLVAGKIAPGTSGYCPIAVSNANSEVGITYNITPSADANKPTNLKFYKDATHQQAITGTVEGSLAPGATATVNVYWQWPYETTPIADGDAADTANGVSAQTMTITFDVTGVQVQPVAQ